MSLRALRPQAVLVPLATSAVLWAAASQGSFEEPASPAGTGDERPWSVQLHLHGPSSEGDGSVDSHSFEARAVGVDVLWWSEHDWRASSYHAASAYGFEGNEPLAAGEPWTPRLSIEAGGRGRVARRNAKRLEPTPWASFSTELAAAGETSLRISSEARRKLHPSMEPRPTPEGRERYLRLLRAPRGSFRRPLSSGVTLHLAVHAEHLDPGARPLIRVALSEHPERAVAAAEHPGAPVEGEPQGTTDDFRRWFVEYELVAADGEPPRVALRPGAAPQADADPRDEAVLRLPVLARAGEWNHLALPVSADALRGFGPLGSDNAFGDVELGLEVEPGRETAVHFDALRIETEAEGVEALRRQSGSLRAVAARYPELRTFEGLEVSYLEPHLNVYGLTHEAALPNYDALLDEFAGPATESEPLAAEPFGAFVAERVVAAAHAAGGLVSYNHAFGTDMERSKQDRMVGARGASAEAARGAVLEALLAHRLYGADLLEVGYRDRGGADLAAHLALWDGLAAGGLFPVGTGVSDSHGGPEQRWSGGGNNFVSWILAPAPESDALLDGLARGRVFFGDIEAFDGRLDLVTARGFRMGQVVVSDRPRVELRALVEGAGDALALHWVGATPGKDTGAASAVLPTAADGGRLRVRVELRGPEANARAGKPGPQVLSNAIDVLREVPAGGLAGERAALDLGGIRCGAAGAGMGGVRLWSARLEGGALVLELQASGPRPGWVELELPPELREAEPRGLAASPAEAGLAGSWKRTPAGLRLEDLAGRGSVRVTAGGG